MRIKFIWWLVGSAAVMFLLPWAAVTFAESDAGMAVMLLLFFVIDPIYAIVAGFVAGRNDKEMWSLPVIVPILFLLGAWVFLDMGEEAFTIYAGAYLAIGMAAMLISLWSSGRKSGN